MISLKRHPLSALFSQFDLADADLARLVDDIKANGLQNPIVLLDGKVLDGWNRYTACKKAKVDPITVDYEGSDPWAYVCSLNIARRHMTTTQIAAVYLLKQEMDGVSNSASVSIDTPQSGKPSVRQLSKELGITQASAQRLKKVADSAAPEVKDALKAGKVTLGRAAEVANLPVDEQAQAIEERRKPKPLVEPESVIDDARDFDPIEELEKAQNEIIALMAKNEALMAGNDAAAELGKYVDLYQTSQSRLAGEMTKNAQLDKELRRFGKLHAELRKILGIDDDRQLLAAVKALKVAA